MWYSSLSRIALLGSLITLLASAPAVRAAGFGDYLKQLGAFSFGGSEFDPKDMQGNQKNWADRERWVKEALDKAYQALERSDREVSLYDFQNYYSVLSIRWTPDYLSDPANIGNLNAYATFTEYLVASSADACSRPGIRSSVVCCSTAV